MARHKRHNNDLELLAVCVLAGEEWLMHRILAYAERRQYTKYTSTLLEPWRISIAALTGALTAAIAGGRDDLELSPDENPADDVIAAFAVHEARLHRQRGISLTMFLGLMKYYRQSYLDLLEARLPARAERTVCATYLRRFFDRLEIAFCAEWSGLAADRQLTELQDENRRMTNEKNLYLTALESHPDAIILVDEQGRVREMNPSAMNLIGRPNNPGYFYYAVAPLVPPDQDTPDTLRGQHLREIIPWLEQPLHTAQGSGVRTSLTYLLEAEGRTAHIQAILTPMLDVSRKYQGTLISLADISPFVAEYTALRREQQARQAQERLVLQAKLEWERTVDAMPDMVAIVDRDYKIVRANRKMSDKLSLSYEQMLGQHCYRLFNHRDAPHDYCPHRQTLEDGCGHSVEICNDDLGGDCEITTAPYRDPAGIVVGSVYIVREISERKKVEREKEKLQSQLLHAQKLEAVGQLAAGIAHEINTPIQFIGTNIDFLDEAVQGLSGFLQTVVQETEAAPAALADTMRQGLAALDWDYLAAEMPLAIAQSREGVRRVSSIVRAMKDFSHPGSKHKEPRNLNQIILTTVTVARNAWKYVAEVTTDLDPELPDIPLLGNEMGQVVLNLLVNAAQAIAEKLGPHPEGEKGSITISTRHDDTTVTLRLADSGFGIPELVCPRIFDPFFTTKEVGRGTGQGLAIAHDVVVDKHGGSIEFTTEPGQGTEFVVTLPRRGQ
ncbi:MAG: hypothetical protein BWK76_18625 [Desulfobulbaceae bacterium A2]|nr:MAG: hypothetical protein BWK76_18625 [Desulfobulbaceae bacterium A2]